VSLKSAIIVSHVCQSSVLHPVESKPSPATVPEQAMPAHRDAIGSRHHTSSFRRDLKTLNCLSERITSTARS